MTKEGELLYVTAEGEKVYSTERNPENTPEKIEEKKRKEGLDSMGNKPPADTSFSRPFVKPDSDGTMPLKKPIKDNVTIFPKPNDRDKEEMPKAA